MRIKYYSPLRSKKKKYVPTIHWLQSQLTAELIVNQPLSINSSPTSVPMHDKGEAREALTANTKFKEEPNNSVIKIIL